MPNDEIEDLVNKYSSKSKRRSSSRLNASTPNLSYDHDSSSSSSSKKSSFHNSSGDLLLMADNSGSNQDLLYPGGQYIAGRRHSRASKEKRRISKILRRSSRSPVSTLMEDNHADLIDFHSNNNYTPTTPTTTSIKDPNNTPSSAASTSTATTTATGSTRASVSPNNSFYANTSSGVAVAADWSLSDYADSKYVIRPQKSAEEEQNALLDMPDDDNVDPDDPLANLPTFQDEFDDEMDEIEMRDSRQANFINLGDLEQEATKKKGRLYRRRRMLCCCGFGCLLILVTGILLKLFVADNNNNNHHVANIQQEVPYSPKTLKLTCGEGLDLPQGQWATFPLPIPKECQAACLKAECCWNPNTVYQCSPDTQDNCPVYKDACQIMLPNEEYLPPGATAAPQQQQPQDGIAVPQAPSTLKTTCVPVGPNFTVTQVCHDKCVMGDCCWNTTSTMHCTTDSKQRSCAPYKEFCSFLNQHWPNSGSSNNNGNSNAQQLPFPLASSDLATLCSIATMEQLGPQKCQQQCSQADCCWKVGTVNCASSVPNQMCKAYTNACAVLNNLDTVLPNYSNNVGPGATSTTTTTTPAPAPTTTTTTSTLPFPAAPDGLDVYCNPSEMEEISFHICQDKCGQAECCWSTNVDPCPTSVPAQACQPYAQSCAILNDFATYPGNDNNGNTEQASTTTTTTSNNVPQAPSDLAQRCSKENIIGSDNGGDVLIDCERDCLTASCCWQPNVKEPCTNNDRCAAYEEPCSIFVGLFSGDSGGGDATPPAAGSSSSNVPTAPSDLAATCSPDVLTPSVNFGESIVSCKKICLAAQCCWEQDDNNACPDADGCAPYMEPCGEHLVAALAILEGQTGGTGVSIADSSTSSSATTTTTTANSDATQEIAKACNDQLAFFVKTRCESACAPGACCFDDATECAVGVECDMFAPCRVLHRRRLRRS